MSDSVVKAMSLEDRITQRLHDSIGDLITDADLAKIVERGIERALWSPREGQKRDHYGKPETLPPLVDSLVGTLLTERMTAAVEAWLKDHPERIQAAVNDAMQKGAGAAFVKYLDQRFADLFSYGVNEMQSRGLLPRAPGT